MSIPDYGYRHACATWDTSYVVQPVLQLLKTGVAQGARIFELGCGNGNFARQLQESGFAVTAVDPSESGVRIARNSHPGINFENAAVKEDLAARFGTFDAVVSIEVLEHCYSPHEFALKVFALLRPKGIAVISTPFHGYLKNLALALTGKLENHMNPLWEGGHIKFFSVRSLTTLLRDAGFESIHFLKVGRWPPAFAKSMIAIAVRPG